MRVPATCGEAVRMELRSPDPTCNPYLTLALILAAGLEGIEKKTELAPAVDLNVYDLTEKEMKKLKLDHLPENLWQALAEMKKDPLIREILGEHVYGRYIAAKEAEWKTYDTVVHGWETDRYLTEY
jgi:glutamine synthetase